MSHTSKLSAAELRTLRNLFPSLPESYFIHLYMVGWGELKNGRIIHQSPNLPNSIYPNIKVDHILILGDDSMGFCFGYDTVSKHFGEFDGRGIWTEDPSNDAFNSYVTL